MNAIVGNRYRTICSFVSIYFIALWTERVTSKEVPSCDRRLFWSYQFSFVSLEEYAWDAGPPDAPQT